VRFDKRGEGENGEDKFSVSKASSFPEEMAEAKIKGE
jgi:hypothetical protein